MIERTIAGRYRLLGLLGSGGTSSVHEAIALDGTRVAVKILHPHLARGTAQWDAFLGELRTVAPLDHPGVAAAFDGGIEGDPPAVWLAMELVDGVTIAAHVARHGPLPLAAGLALADALAAAVAAVHAAGIVHRDLTPANVMFDPSTLAPLRDDDLRRSVRLLDFGIAAAPGHPVVGTDALLSSTGSEAPGVVASLRYASPEHLTGGPISEAADVYQLAGTILFALTGAPPFLGDERAVVDGHLTGRPPVASDRVAAIPRPVDRFLIRGLLKSPGDRYPDAAHLRRALEDAVAQGTSRAGDLELAGDRPRVDDADGLAPTLHYRTTVTPEESVSPRAPVAASGWSPFLVGAGAVVVVAVVVAVSFAAGTRPQPRAETPSASATAQTPSPAPTVATPLAVVVRGVPDIVGSPLAEAQRRLTEAGFRVGATASVPSPSPAGIVVAADPKPGQLRAAGTAIALSVATGENAVPVTTGLTVAAASAALAAAGFAASVQGGGRDDPAAELIGTDPPAFTMLTVGATVALLTVVEEPDPTAEPSPTASPSGTPEPWPSPSPSQGGVG